ncbi:hypothetical protein [Microbacterium capsulatum]|uniref:Uncharacterized protein n=1 Tax=Microbacterium capsulatum TaxID=3041921 RepID=A0ABU0XFP8_9MICO|nr:hypothetical protein [Microbacterium sp. ASV81]MDQ4213727.1 hypothetical protein [Microbacterium sp. ASV81]
MSGTCTATGSSLSAPVRAREIATPSKPAFFAAALLSTPISTVSAVAGVSVVGDGASVGAGSGADCSVGSGDGAGDGSGVGLSVGDGDGDGVRGDGVGVGGSVAFGFGPVGGFTVVDGFFSAVTAWLPDFPFKAAATFTPESPTSFQSPTTTAGVASASPVVVMPSAPVDGVSTAATGEPGMSTGTGIGALCEASPPPILPTSPSEEPGTGSPNTGVDTVGASGMTAAAAPGKPATRPTVNDATDTTDSAHDRRIDTRFITFPPRNVIDRAALRS